MSSLVLATSKKAFVGYTCLLILSLILGLAKHHDLLSGPSISVLVSRPLVVIKVECLADCRVAGYRYEHTSDCLLKILDIVK